MLLDETWHQVAGWGIEAIKNIQTHVGLTDEDDSTEEFVLAPLPTLAMGGIFSPSEAEHEETDTASSQLAAVKAAHDALSKTREALRAQVPQPINRSAAAGELVQARARRVGRE
jgi:hypothetical protein